MHRETFPQLTKALTVVIAISSAFPAVGANTPAGPLGGPHSRLTDDEWMDDLSTALNGLNVILMAVRTAPDLDAEVETIRELYFAEGIPPGADLVAGRGYIRQIYSILQKHPEALDAALYQAFMGELPKMYRSMGGDPVDLLSGSR